MDGQLLVCPHCAPGEKHLVLGRLLTNGDMMILRFHSGTTILHADHYNLSCGCGFTFQIQGTVVTGTIQLTI